MAFMDADAVVVGAGVMGLAAAWRLASAGADVIVLEQFCVGHVHGSSHGPTRVFRTLYGDPVYVRMAQRAIPLWRELESVSGASLLRMTGGLIVDDERVLARHRASLETCGESFEVLAPDERRARFPWLDTDGDALFVDNMGVISADATVSALNDAARDAGAVVIEDAPVSLQEGAVEAAGKRYRAGTIVVTAGAWTAPLLASAGIELPVRVTREQVLFFAADASELVPFVHGVPYWVYAVPGDGVVKVAEHGRGAETTAAGRSFDLDEADAARVVEYVKRVLPLVDPEPVSFETCLYTSTPSEDFVIDRAGPFLVCSPCSGHGFKFAPLIGEIVTAMVHGDNPSVPVERFALP